MHSPLLVKVRYGFLAASIAWLFTALVPLSDAGLSLPAFVILTYTAVALGAFWLFLFVTSRRGSHPQSALASLVAFPAAALIVLLLKALDPVHNPLFRLRFLVSRSSLAAAAEAALVAPPMPPGRLGLFRIIRHDVGDNQVLFITTGCGLVDQCGIVYSPTRPPTRIFGDRFASLGGPWYHVFQRF